MSINAPSRRGADTGAKEPVMLNENLEAALAIVAFLLTFLIPVRGVSILGRVRQPIRR